MISSPQYKLIDFYFEKEGRVIKIMNNYCMIEITFSNKREVEESIEKLLNNKLVASCQIIESNSF